MIIAYTGMPGSGKTLALAYRAMKAQRAGRIVFSNVNIKGSYKISMEDLINYRFPEGCDVIIDEAGRWFNSRTWKDLPPEVFDMFTMHRHLQMNLYIGVQSFARIDKSLREVVELVYWARNSPILPWHKYEGYYDLEKVGSMKKDYNVSHIIWKTRKVRGMFNTHSMKGQFAHKEEVPYIEWNDFAVSNKTLKQIMQQKSRIKKKQILRKKKIRSRSPRLESKVVYVASPKLKRNIKDRGIIKRTPDISYPVKTIIYVQRQKKEEAFWNDWKQSNQRGFVSLTSESNRPKIEEKKSS